MEMQRCTSMVKSVNKKNNLKQTSKTKNSARVSFCRVCGDKASIKNYGGLSCQSCKIFFRRNGFRPENVQPCALKQSCDITLYTRRTCTGCRLKKCLSIGMSPDLIRKEEPKARTGVFRNKPKIHSMSNHKDFSTCHSPDQVYAITVSEKKLVAKIIHTYQTFTAVSETHQIMKDLDNDSIPKYDHSYDLFIALLQVGYRSMYFIINAIPDFRVLTSIEQCSLIERNLHGLVSFHMMLTLQDMARSNNMYSLRLLQMVYGQQMFPLLQLIRQHLHFDPTVVKLTSIVLAFSANCFMVDSIPNAHQDSLLFGTHRLLGSQNVYVELMWNYLNSEYGYYKSIHYLEKLMGFILQIIKYSTTAYLSNQTYHTLVNNLMNTMRYSLVRNQNESIPLWGKL